MGTIKSGVMASVAVMALLSWGSAALAATPDETRAALERLEKQVAEQANRLSEQDKVLANQRAMLAHQEQALQRLQQLSDVAMQTARGAGAGVGEAPAAETPPPVSVTSTEAAPLAGGPAAPVGEAPPAQKVVVESIPESAGVLTPKGHFVLEPQFDYTHGSTNRLVFRGVEIVTGIQIGVIEASDADRNAIEGAIDGRYGLTNRLELEARVPYLFRSDRVTTLAQRDSEATRTEYITGHDIGDVELAARYQLNDPSEYLPVFIAGLRVKSNTGSNPYTIQRDEFGVAEKLATGSGFWAVQGSLNMLYPTDPAVIFAGISYTGEIPRTLNKVVDNVLIGRVVPGNSIGVNAGFGFALNPRFSFSLGYKHEFIESTKVVLGGTNQKSQSLQIGAFTVGWSFALTPRIVISNTYAIGTTRDAPDMEVLFRLPIRF